MSNQLLIESHQHQTRVAILEDGRLMEAYIERGTDVGLVGSIYKGKVRRVLPGMQAAFVDLGLERDGFLYAGDLVSKCARDRTTADETQEVSLGDVDGVSRDEIPSIADLVAPGDTRVVQIVKEPLPNKGARISTQLSLPTHYLVLLPGGVHVGVSRRIEDEEERERLRTLLEGLVHEGDGLIARTASHGKSLIELGDDYDKLVEIHQAIQSCAAKSDAPVLLHHEVDLVERAIRDFVGDDFVELWVDGADVWERVAEMVEQLHPRLRERLRQSQDENLFEHFGVEHELQAALKNKVWLKSGAHLVINPTEALVSIDVNTGRFVGETNLEETVLVTNLEAVPEIARQIRLRDLGGIVVVDFIDMVLEDHREQVVRSLAEELQKDRAKTRVTGISEFGLVEMTRRRSRSSLRGLLTRPCPYCGGDARIKSLATICLEIRRTILRSQAKLGRGAFEVRAHPEVLQELQGAARGILEELQERLGSKVSLFPDPSRHHEQFEVVEA